MTIQHSTLPEDEKRIFGLRISPWTAPEIARHILETPRPAEMGLGLVVTPNIQHIAVLRTDAAFRAAYDDAAIVICDGFPVHYYARLRGCPSPGRVTGCDLAADIMDSPSFPPHLRFFFVLDHPDTERAVHEWAARRGLSERVATIIPPFGFEQDKARCLAMAQTIRDHGTTFLIMGVGAPRSEVFVHRHQDILQEGWAICVGQAVKMALGLTPRPPKAAQTLNLEWFWRILLEPRRMAVRYVKSIGGFLLAVIEDLRGANDRG